MRPVFVDVEGAGGLRLRTVRSWHAAPFVHAFTDRYGGVSRAPFHTLNVGLHVGDDTAAVRRNRERVAAALERQGNQFVAGEQVHGNRVAVVTGADKGRGAYDLADGIAGVDGLVTRSTDVLLMAFFADCVPILLYDDSSATVGVVHAGWKGTVGDVVGRAIAVMTDVFHVRPEKVQAAIGPSIGPCCYGVGDDVAEKVRQAVGSETGAAAEVVVEGRDGKPHVDLPGANKHLLIRAGLAETNVFVDRLCTRCHVERFFSHRGDKGTTGRFAAVIGLNPGAVG